MVRWNHNVAGKFLGEDGITMSNGNDCLSVKAKRLRQDEGGNVKAKCMRLDGITICKGNV
jgi:hypothetical protein